MTPAKLDIMFAFFSYGGNGGIPMCHPSIRRWWAQEYHRLHGDERIGRVAEIDLCDTPISMTRNRAIRTAIEGGYDMLVMVDSDQHPDLYAGKDSSAKPFMPSSFDFAYERLLRGVPTIIGAPYCGPPPHPVHGGEENVYVFKWANLESDTPNFAGARVVPFDRDEAARMTGIGPAAALPTGMILFTTDVFSCLPPPYVRYEYKDTWEHDKVSTEDVYVTRNLAMAGIKKWGENVQFCNWDSWVGHYKPKCVGRPTVLYVEQVADTFAEATRNDYHFGERIVHVNPERPTPSTIEALGLASNPQHDIDTDVVNGPAELLDTDVDDDPLDYDIEHDWQPEIVNGVRVMADNTLVSATDRDSIKSLLRYWNASEAPKTILYIGEPEPATVCEMVKATRGGTVFCVTDTLTNLQRESMKHVIDDKVKLIPWTGPQEFWNQDEADMVFIHRDFVGTETARKAVAVCSDSGIVIGTGDASFGRKAPDIESACNRHIHRHVNGTLWSIWNSQEAEA